MEREGHYTNKDFQEVLNESFSGNIEIFNSHLLECTDCKYHFETYRKIVGLIRNEAIQFQDMSSIVDQSWKQVQEARYSQIFDKIQYWIAITVCVILIALCLGYLVSVGVSAISFTMVLAFIGMFLLISYKEIKLSAPN